MFRAFSAVLARVHEHPGTPPAAALHPPPSPTGDLVARVEALERAEALRAAEHAAMVDQLSRLYKRVATRIAREAPTEAGDSPLTFRRRLGK